VTRVRRDDDSTLVIVCGEESVWRVRRALDRCATADSIQRGAVKIVPIPEHHQSDAPYVTLRVSRAIQVGAPELVVLQPLRFYADRLEYPHSLAAPPYKCSGL